MEVVVAVQSGTLLHALRVQLKRRVSARRGGDYFGLVTAEVRQARSTTTTLARRDIYPESRRFWHHGNGNRQELISCSQDKLAKHGRSRLPRAFS